MQAAHRFFFAALPPSTLRLRIGNVLDGLADVRSPVAGSRLHITLGLSADFSSYPDALAASMRGVGDRLQAAPATITLDRLAASRTSIALRPGHRLLGLQALGDALAGPLVRRGICRPGWRFSPHVTLGYRQGEPFSRQVAAIDWVADEVVLIHSVVGETRYIVLGRWRLRPRQGELFH